MMTTLGSCFVTAKLVLKLKKIVIRDMSVKNVLKVNTNTTQYFFLRRFKIFNGDESTKINQNLGERYCTQTEKNY